jgi:hypothetical protein
MAVALRTALIWHDEVMADVVTERPAPVTLGASRDATFVTPELGLPPDFKIVTPTERTGSRYILTLATGMRGTICVGGVEHDVAELVRVEASGFHATSIGDGDWGVVDLDASGDCKLFFTFVPLEEPAWVLTPPVVLAGFGGYLLASALLGGIWTLAGVDVGEAMFRGAAISALALGLAALVRAIWKQDTESRASLAFSVVLHTAILFVTFQLYSNQSQFVWPGSRALAGDYLVTRIDDMPPPADTAGPGASTPTLTATTVTTPPRSERLQPPSKPPDLTPRNKGGSTKGGPTAGPADPRGGVLDHGDILDDVAGRNTASTAQRYGQVGAGPRDETPGHGGPHTRGGPSGNGPAGQHRTKDGAIDVGPLRDAVVCLGEGCEGGGKPIIVTPPPTDDGPPPLTASEIDRVVRAKAGIFRVCYQKELNRIPMLGGKLVAFFVIARDGSVREARITSDTVGNEAVASCVLRNIRMLRFPAKGGANVTYPFFFTSG